MTPTSRHISPAFRLAAIPLTIAMLITLTLPAAASGRDRVIVLPGAGSAEGITAGRGTTFYAGDLFRGDIYLGDVQRGRARLFIDAPDGRMAVGMDADLRHDLLFVAGGPGGAYVYDLDSGATVATYSFGAGGFVNDVTVTRSGAWFTDSVRAQLYFVPVGRDGPGTAVTLPLSGPAADTSGDFNLNGITSTENGKTLVVAHSGNGELYTVDPATGASAVIAGVDVPNVDGIILEGNRLWAVRNSDYRVDEYRLTGSLTSGRLTDVITSTAFGFPTTAARFGDRLAVVNAHFDTGFPPTAPEYEVVITRA